MKLKIDDAKMKLTSIKIGQLIKTKYGYWYKTSKNNKILKQKNLQITINKNKKQINQVRIMFKSTSYLYVTKRWLCLCIVLLNSEIYDWGLKAIWMI